MAFTATVSDDNASGTDPLNGVTFLGDVQSGTYANLRASDGVVLDIDDDLVSSNEIDYVAEFSLPSNAIPTILDFTGYLQGTGDTGIIQAYDHDALAWETVASLVGIAAATNSDINAPLGQERFISSAGKVYVRFISTAPSSNQTLVLDRLLCSYEVRTVGYSDGAIWVDTQASNTSTEKFVDGTADNPVSTWAAALTLATALGMDRFRVHGGSSITLTADSSSYEIIGDGLWSLNLGGQTVTSAYIKNANVSGTGNGTGVIMEDCRLGDSVSIPSGYYVRCGVAATSGTPLTGSTAGEYALVDCVSVVAGSATPYMDFSGLGSSSGINIRRWAGGANVTLDSNNTLSLETLAGGGQTITTGGANVELRGLFRSANITVSASETVQVIATTGPITITDNASTAPTINLYGVAASVTDGTGLANDMTLNLANIPDAILKRGVANTEDTADSHSLTEIILATLESAISGNKLTIRKTTGEDFSVKSLTSNPNADPIVSIT